MKKLLTIALALVMVLALAAPAMATVGFGPQPETTPPTATEWSVKIRALEFIPATNGFTFENNYYPDYDPTKGIVAGSDIRFVVDVNFPKYGDIKDYDLYEDNFNKLKLTVSGNNLAFGWWNGETVTPLNIINTASYGHELNGSLPRVTTNSPTKAVKYLTLANYAAGAYPWSYNAEKLNSISYAFGSQLEMYGVAASYTCTYTFMFVADVLNTADVTVSATVSATGRTFDKGESYSFTYGGNTYVVEHTVITGGNYYDMYNEDEPHHVVRFTTDSKDQITNVAVSLNDLAGYEYQSIRKLTAAESFAANTAVKAISDGTYDTAAIEAMNATAAYNKLVQTITAGTTDPTLSAADTTWINRNVAVKKAGNADWTNTDTQTELLAAIAAQGLALKTVAAVKELMTPAGQNQIVWPDLVTNTNATDTDAAWKIYNDTLAAADKIVIGINADQLASSITGIPLDTNFASSVPFLGKLEAGYMNHAQWWNVNKDVKLAEIVFNVNDKVHTQGYEKATFGAAVVRIGQFASKTDVTLGVHVTDPTSLPKYAWCSEKAGLDVYAESIKLYDGTAVTASKDVNQFMYKQLYPVFKEMMDVLEFTWDGTTAYMYRAAFVEKFGGKLSTSASYTYAAYTSALVVADPNAQPPQTGDTTSILGFVMIAVAVLAAGAVVVKKVRA